MGETVVLILTKLITIKDNKIEDIYTPLSPKNDLPKILNIKKIKKTNNIS